MNLEGIKSFLKSPDFKLNEVSTGKSGGTVSTKPTKGDIKISRNGRIFFSDELKAQMSTVSTVDGESVTDWVNGIDFVNTTKWSMWPNKDQKAIFVTLTPLADPKLCAKVDVRKESDSAAGFTAIKDQVIPMLQELYGLDTDFSWAEYKINKDIELSGGEVCVVPKVVTRGEDKGKTTFARRENAIFWLLEPITEVEETPAEEAVEEAVVVEAEDDSIVSFDSDETALTVED